jgi:diacylglycerol kinase family enzyme
MYYILFNPLSSNGKSIEVMEKLKGKLAKDGHPSEAFDIIEVSKDIDSFLKRTDKDDKVVILGGDGTLHYFVNGIRNIVIEQEIFLYKGGTGNDFSREFKNKEIINITPYIRELPTFKVNGEETDKIFINGVGFGLDGAVCCGVNDSGTKKSGIAYIKNLLSLIKHFPRYDLEVWVDGVRHTYKKVWLATVTNGKYFGGGMKISPVSDRTDDILELYVIHSVSFLKLLFIFPTIFIGKHMLFKKVGISLVKGRQFKLVSNAPIPFQSDGEVVIGVNEFEVNIEKKN